MQPIPRPLALLAELKTVRPGLPVILMTAWGSISLAVDGMKAGASDFVTKPWTNQQILQAVEYVSSYLRDQRERYLPLAAPLSEQHQTIMRPYFSATLLDQVKAVELHGARVPNPPFYEEAKALGFVSLPDLTHMNSLTFLDVLVFNEGLTQRSLFHALVHAVQFQVMGLKRYTEIFVHNFVNTRFHFRVPLEAHTFFLESKFARPAAASFSVEDQVRLWVQQNRY